MTRRWIGLACTSALLGVLLGAAPGQAGLFNNGIGSAMIYGPYTGGHIYSYNVAYGYGLPFSPADTWRYYPVASRPYYYPYTPPNPLLGRFHAVPASAGPDGVGGGVPGLQPVPGTVCSAVIQVRVPDGAEVWVDGEKTTQTGTERAFTSPPLEAGKNYISMIRAKWSEAGRETEQFQPVNLQAGGTASVSFPAQRP